MKGDLVEIFAAVVHAGRFAPGQDATPWEAEDESGKVYCRRIARLVLNAGAAHALRADDILLPCAVHLPGETTIGAGCKLSTLLEALELRRKAGAGE